ncbi:MAG TPA: hypothetical protein PLM93_11945 [Sulfuricurvum sp.]|nr:MAG: hypothetical protein B7X89_12205 [Sulfuricurvum sp. 17-40-25]HQS67888.1 hypothetical protein [Sulfuricurvum sp.]HQT37067.1 hypothetical protein [Sulfuricurvum sp.]
MAIKLQGLKKELEQGTFIDTDEVGIFVEYVNEEMTLKLNYLKKCIKQSELDEAIAVINEIMVRLE